MANLWTVPGDFTSINAALSSASVQDFDTIRVGPGLYTNATEGGPIIINKMIQLLGAQTGVDARTRSVPTSAESIIQIVDIVGSIQVYRDNVVIDGFTVQNNTLNVGIFTSASNSGYWIFNNIIQNNAGGLYFNTDTSSPNTTFAQAKFNFFKTNNQSSGSGPGGNGIYTQFGSQNVYIDSNKFTGHTPAASINFAAGSFGSLIFDQRNIVISNNEMINDNSISLTFTTNVKITGNVLNNTQGTAIFIAGGTNLTEIEGNIITNSTGSGISVNTVFTTPADANAAIRAKDNSIQGNAGAGLNIDTGAYNPVPRRLDATNNWWGSSTGPTSPANPGGTGDSVVDPDNVAEIVPFLTANPLPTPPGTVAIEPVGRLASTQSTTYVATTKTNAVNAAISGTGTFAQAVGNVIGVWPEFHDYSAPNNASLFGDPQFVWEDTTMSPGELRYFSQAFQIESVTSHVVVSTVFTDNAHKLYIEEYNSSFSLVQSITPGGGLNDGIMNAATPDTVLPYNWQKIRQYSKVFTPIQAGNFIVVTVEALNYNGAPPNPAGVSLVADFYQTNV